MKAALLRGVQQPLTIEDINRITELSTFSSMKKDPRTSMQLWDEEQRKPGMPFMRKGEAGDWVNHFTPELAQAFDRAFKVKMAVEVEAGKTYFWCQCGLSSKQPFCDGSHKSTAFTPIRYQAEESKKVFFCGCKQSKSQPLCDGTHKSL